jgi:transcriptional regulator with AAA-type ATPase domain
MSAEVPLASEPLVEKSLSEEQKKAEGRVFMKRPSLFEEDGLNQAEFEERQNPASLFKTALSNVGSDVGITSIVADFEKTILIAAMEKAKFNQREAAKDLKLTYHQLRHKLKKHDL